MKLLNLIIIVASLSVLISCSSTKNIAGTYRSNFADLGFFVTMIKLKKDSTFEYRFRGDLFNDTATGHYEINGHKLLLHYKEVPMDTSGFANMRSIGFKLDSNSLKSVVPRNYVFYIRRNKIYESYQNEKIVTKAFGYSKWEKYFLFGTHYYKHKHYLKKIY